MFVILSYFLHIAKTLLVLCICINWLNPMYCISVIPKTKIQKFEIITITPAQPKTTKDVCKGEWIFLYTVMSALFIKALIIPGICTIFCILVNSKKKTQKPLSHVQTKTSKLAGCHSESISLLNSEVQTLWLQSIHVLNVEFYLS